MLCSKTFLSDTKLVPHAGTREEVGQHELSESQGLVWHDYCRQLHYFRIRSSSRRCVGFVFASRTAALCQTVNIGEIGHGGTLGNDAEAAWSKPAALPTGTKEDGIMW